MGYFEWTQNARQQAWSEDEVNRQLEEYMQLAYRDVEAARTAFQCSMRTAAFIVAIRRVKEAMDARGFD